MSARPRVIDNDRDEITVTFDGEEIRVWQYRTEDERRVKTRMAHEFVEGWFHATERAIRIANEQYGQGPDGHYDSGGTRDGWNMASQEIKRLISALSRTTGDT